jgi:predicted nucleic acid-binding protein
LILVDTSVWVDHLRKADAPLATLLEQGRVATHPFVVGEIACGSLRNRPLILELLQDLPGVVVAENDEVLGFMARHRLHGRGIGYVDVHLLAAVALTPGSVLWTRDRRLHAAAHELDLAHPDAGLH